ncbi:ABC transporter ATP-binding protein [Legionella parisiensis]|uniref:Teichoic acids export ATP-binding protein TagH n=1 Tax=Legionella parisiensis TaxID=45071 RepID=A0A1E5JL44_9GAMM|nr:ABC transporter ATP-binding protein [Legionella parisiensis]KTD41678.1 ABC transporter of LPS O-antigen [Legionella parisiensis]OEH45276.1 Teichoic acids export ATP-binding protein TagH [Legionella parisiensis]STX76000.1 ABC transporter of LPS O-antigen [Legionella parisiensis]
MTSEIVIDVVNVSKRYESYSKPQDRLKQVIMPRLYQTGASLGIAKNKKPIYFREFWALQNVSVQVRRGETFGIIGRNGSGKSTLLQIIAGILTPTSGSVTAKGRLAALLELGSGFNPEFTGKENIFLNGYILGLNQTEIQQRYEQIVEFADIGDFINQPVKTYSSGMFVRLAFAVQAHVNADIVIIDEALAVGDIFFRQKCYTHLEKLKESGTVILLVSHSMNEIEQHCERAILLENGLPFFLGSAIDATKHYYLLHQPSGKETKQFTTNQLSSEQRTQKKINTNKADIWDDNSIFLDASRLHQVTNHNAKCTRYVLCDSSGNPCTRFSQGDVAVFYYEFLLLQSIPIPLGGIVIRNDKGIIVHGKGSLEYDVDVSSEQFKAGTLIRCQQMVTLQLQPGEYSFDIGLASINSKSYKDKSFLNHDELFNQIIRICHLSDVGILSIGMRTGDRVGSQLTHHGIADLPGKFMFAFAECDEKLSLAQQVQISTV